MEHQSQIQHQTQTQTQTDFKADSSDKFFLPSFANRRSSRTNSSNLATNLATAGLFSALAACGGDSDSGGDGLATFTIDSLNDAFDETARRDSERTLSEVTRHQDDFDAISTLTFATSEDTAKEFKFSRPGSGNIKLNYDNGTTNTSDDTAFSVSVQNSSTHGLRTFDIEIDGNGKDELAVGWFYPYQGMIIIWDFAEQITGNNNTLSFTGNKFTDGTSSSGADVNLSLNRLHIYRSDVSSQEFKDLTSAKIGDDAAVLIGEDLYQNATGLGVGAIYLIWNAADYKNTVTAIDLAATGAADKLALADKVLAIHGSDDKQAVGKDLREYKFPLPKIDNDDKEEFYVSAIVDTTGLPGWFYVIWDIADHKGTGEIILKGDGKTNPTTGVLSIFSNEKRSGLSREFADLDGDGMKDIILGSKTGTDTTSPDTKVYIIWADAVTDDTGQGREGVIKLGEKTGGNINAFTNDGFTQNSNKFANAGLQIGVPVQTAETTDPSYIDYLKEIADNFRFGNVNVDGDVDGDIDGIKDAVAYNANADGTYNWWKMTAAENVLSGDGSAATPYTFAETANQGGSKSAADFANLGIATGGTGGYAKQKVNDDDYADLVARESEGGLHKVWLGTAAGTFDVSQDADVYARVASSSSSALEDSAADFQLVDIA